MQSTSAESNGLNFIMNPIIMDQNSETNKENGFDINLGKPPQEGVKIPKKRFIGRRAAAERAEKTGITKAAIEENGAIQGIPLQAFG